MLNLYPQRSTDPRGMHLVNEAARQEENEQHSAALLDGRPLTLLGAWGELIATRSYLPQLLAGIVAVNDASACEWVSIGDLLKSGHPRHPSREGYALPLQRLDVTGYLRAIGV